MTMLMLSVFGALLSGVLAFWRRPQMPRFWLLLAIAAVPQFGNLAGVTIPGMFFIAIAVIAIWCVYNRAIPGTALVALGIGLNLLVMGLHGGLMPVRTDILASLGMSAAPGTVLAGSKDVVIETSALWLLSDWIILSLGATKVVVSPGDLIIVAGVAWWLLFSHRPGKDQAHADIIDQTSLARTAHAPAPWAE
ncbi:MAG TPA: DUF5317 family protein [Roseiflexaceae bacterium]|nr:DUF5317 family protein [Roseiflexaceae bacterium]